MSLNVAMIGCGIISATYLRVIITTFREIKIIGVCDLIRERAEKAQREYNIPKLYETMYDAFADPDVDIVLNLTRPYQHFDVTKAALEAGKAVFTEKPLGASFEEGLELVRIAKEKGLMIGGAPDTFLGASLQTSRFLIDSGYIGEPVGAAAFFNGHGPESWHPDPDFFYQFGGGPMFDMGPYYVTTLINMLGGVSGVSGMTGATFKERMITAAPHFGEMIKVNCPTYISGTMRFDSGIIGSIWMTFDVYESQTPRVEIYGTEGTLSIPDPNCFGGPVGIWRPEDGQWKEFPLMFPYAEQSRGLGLADFAKSIETGRCARCGWQQPLHVLEIMESFTISSETGKYIELKTKYERPKPMDPSFKFGILD